MLMNKSMQKVLYWSTYVSYLVTGCYLTGTSFIFNIYILPGVIGIIMMTAFLLYLCGNIGNHRMKIYTLILQSVYFDVAIGILIYTGIVTGESTAVWDMVKKLRLIELIGIYWIPSLGYLFVSTCLPSISEIVPNKLYLGNGAVARNSHLLETYQITHVLEFTTGRFKNDPTKIHANVLQLECTDLPDSTKPGMDAVIPQAIEFIDMVMNNNEEPAPESKKILVHCAAGVSRSPAMVSHWLVVSGRQPSLKRAISFVSKARPCVDINSDHIKSIQQFTITSSSSERET